MAVNDEGARRKIEAARKLADVQLAQFVEDAASYTQAKLVDSVMNGASGTSYPKAYPGSITPGVGGYIGVVTSNLRRSIGQVRLNKHLIIIKQVSDQLAPHHDKMILWSTRRYGINFYDITAQLYRGKVGIELFRVLRAMLKQITEGKAANYKNPFPE